MNKVKSRIIKSIVYDIFTLYYTDEAINRGGIIGFYFDGFGFPQEIHLTSCFGELILKQMK